MTEKFYRQGQRFEFNGKTLECVAANDQFGNFCEGCHMYGLDDKDICNEYNCLADDREDGTTVNFVEVNI